MANGSYDDVVYCSVCNTELSRVAKVIDALGHKEKPVVVENRVEPTCVANGSYDDVVYCSVCNTELSRAEKVIDALGHVYDDKYDSVCNVCDEKRDAPMHPAIIIAISVVGVGVLVAIWLMIKKRKHT